MIKSKNKNLLKLDKKQHKFYSCINNIKNARSLDTKKFKVLGQFEIWQLW